MKNTTTTVVIAAGLVLAAVIVTRTPAQQEVGVNGACCLPTGGCALVGNQPICDSVGGTFLGNNTTCAGSTCPSVAPPTVVSVSMIDYTLNGDGQHQLVRAWSDGQVDAFTFTLLAGSCNLSNLCGPVVIAQGTCPTDINRDGDTDIQDFLTLLGGWGACK